MSKGKETRQRIVAEAAGLFNQHGFEGASLAELMQATSLEKGGIYRHFRSKEELAVEAFEYAWRLASDARTSKLEAISDSVDKLTQFISNFVEWRSPVPGGCPLMNLAIDADDGNSVLRACAVKALQEWSGTLASIVEGGIKRRKIRRGVDPKKLASLIISTLEGALMISRLAHNREALLAAQSHLLRYLETEVRVRPGRAPAKAPKSVGRKG
jgi:TetR/AcrR family transcriptional regulator, transcriptional repressor for nem operon